MRVLVAIACMGMLCAGVCAAEEVTVRIGSYYTDALNGIAFIAHSGNTDTAAFLLRVGWIGADGKLHESYPDLVAGSLRPGPTAPDFSYSHILWKADGTTITFEWGRSGDAAAVGRVTANRPTRIVLRGAPSWPEFHADYKLTDDGIEGAGGGETWRLVAAGTKAAPENNDGEAASLTFDVRPGSPVRFVAGFAALPSMEQVDETLSKAQAAYVASRSTAFGDWGDFVGAIPDNMNNSRPYNHERKMIAHSVSRGWCCPDGQVLFCWDSFFNGLLSCIEDPNGAKDTVRAILSYQQQSGFIPNFAGPTWGVSSDRSQPPVAAMCVWKMHQRHADREFLAEVYPKLVRWHAWWFAPRPSDGKPYRDGNRNGLLEWGSENANVNDSKLESGLDDSPMFDDARVLPGEHTIDIDDVGLSALWGMDADYLARIADAIGKPDEATAFRDECKAMAKRIDDHLWNEKLGVYCNRYWEPRHPTAIVPSEYLRTPDGSPGLHAEYFTGTGFETPKLARTDPTIDFAWNDLSPDPTIERNNYSVRWTGTIRPPASDTYVFDTQSDDGVRLWVDGKLVIDNWTIHAPTMDSSEPIALEAGKEYAIKMEFYQAGGGAEIHLRWSDPNTQPQVFSTRLSPTLFYPMILGGVSQERAKRMCDLLRDPSKFWGEYVCPTIARDDPSFPIQHYWRGKIWGPTNYLMWLGLKRCAPEDLRVEFAKKSAAIFMRNWTKNGTCNENFLSTGEGSSDPHYTWGALMCLIALEEICDIEPDGRIRLNGLLHDSMTIRNLPISGKLYDVIATEGKAELRRGSSTVLKASGSAKPMTLGDQ